MKVIKSGGWGTVYAYRKMKKKFRCLYCGCLFKAEDGEYSTEVSHTEHSFITYYVSECPDCRKYAVIGFRIGKEPKLNDED